MFVSILARTINLFVQVMIILIVARALLSWFRPSSYQRWYYQLEHFLWTVTEPIMGPIRNAIPLLGPIDISPIIAIFGLEIAQNLVLRLLYLIL